MNVRRTIRLFHAALIAVAWLVLAGPSAARLTANELDQVGVKPPPGARVPLTAALIDDHGFTRRLGEVIGGKPTILIFVDYTCRTLCGPILALSSAGLAKTGLKPGKDFRMLVIGLDARDGPDTAQRMQRDQMGRGALAAASTFLLADDTVVPQITRALGYRYVYDPTIDQYAHPAVVFVLAADGRVTRTLAALGLDPADLRLALVEAGQGKIGTFGDYLHLLCYGFDPAKGIYTVRILKVLTAAAVVTVLALGGGIGFMLIGRPRREPPYPPENAPSGPA